MVAATHPHPPDAFFFFFDSPNADAAMPADLDMALPGLPLPADDPSKKIRKPYTITKSRESWTDQEHDKFFEALQLFDRDWKKIEAYVGSKTVIQIRSHAQKYFLKVQKSGTNEHLPPPRPKRKAAHPYPQKASKISPVPSQTIAFQGSSCLAEPAVGVRADSASVLRNSLTSTTLPSWGHSSVLPTNISPTRKDDVGPSGPAVCCSSTESPPGTWPSGDLADHANHGLPLQVMPDFGQVYSFIGSVFDPHASGHLEKLKEMDPVDVETVLLLMRNLSVNLSSPDFEDHRRLLSSYDAGGDEVKSGEASANLPANDSHNARHLVKENE